MEVNSSAEIVINVEQLYMKEETPMTDRVPLIHK